MFYFEVTKEQYSVTKRMQIRLPTACKLLRINGHLKQAVKVALLHKEEAARHMLTASETKYPGSKFY